MTSANERLTPTEAMGLALAAASDYYQHATVPPEEALSRLPPGWALIDAATLAERLHRTVCPLDRRGTPEHGADAHFEHALSLLEGIAPSPATEAERRGGE